MTWSDFFLTLLLLVLFFGPAICWISRDPDHRSLF